MEAPMAIDDSKGLLQAQVELWNQAYSFMKSVALGVALDLRIADAIHRHDGGATLSLSRRHHRISPCKLHGLRRLMCVLTIAGTFTTTSSDDGQEPVYTLTTASRLLVSNDGGEEGSASASANLSPMLNHVLHPFRDSVLSMGLTAWFRHDDGDGEHGPPCPFDLMHGETLWEMSARDDAVNAIVNSAMAADSHFLMPIFLKELGEILRGVDSLVDVGGAVAAAFPSLKCSVLDLPHVVAKAPSISNVQFVAGDMFDSIPPANAVLLKVPYVY